MKPKHIKKLLLSEISSVSNDADKYCLDPQRNFSRTRKLPFDVVLKGIDSSVLLKFALEIVANGEWPSHLSDKKPVDGISDDELYKSLKQFFKHKKGDGSLAELIQFCNEDEMPLFIKSTIQKISETVYPETEHTGTDEV